MNFLRRALYSVMRKKGKSLILFALIFILGNVIAGAIAIEQSTKNVEKNIKKQLGATATIEIDSKIYEDQSIWEDESFEGPGIVTLDTIKKVGESSYIKYYDYNRSMYIASKNLKSYTPENEDVVMGNGDGEDSYITIKGVNYPKLIDVEENKIKIVEGRVFTQEEINDGKAVAIISTKFAEENSLAVGDEMIADNNDYKYLDNGEQELLFTQNIPLEVIGIFEPTKVEVKDTEDQNQQIMDTERFNTVYVSNTMISETTQAYYEEKKEKDPEFFLDEDGNEIEGMFDEYYQSVYVLKSPDDIEAFKQENDPLLPEHYIVKTSADNYEQIGGSIDKMSTISKYIVIIAVIATLLIITLVVLLFLRDRKHELGIYLSLGESRGRVMGQILTELLVVSAIAICLSLVTGNFIGGVMSDSLMASDTFTQNGNDMSWGIGIWDPTYSNVTEADVLDAYEVTFSLGYVITFITVGLGTILLSAIIPLLYILRLNPKKIMM